MTFPALLSVRLFTWVTMMVFDLFVYMGAITTQYENLNCDQRDTVCKACTLEPCIQIMRITKRKSCTSYETIKIMRIMKQSAHQINIFM